MKVRLTHILAAASAFAIGYWMWGEGSSYLEGGRLENARAPISERANDEEARLFAVKARVITPEVKQETLLLRGRTQADVKVGARSETSGVVQTLHVTKGITVAKGDPLCTLEQGAREASLAEAKAAVAQAQQDYDASLALLKENFTPESQVKANKAQLDSAFARLRAAEIELARTNIVAPVAGLIQDPVTETGEFLSVGAVCATIIQMDPLVITGQISEQEIANISIGAAAAVRLVTGEEVTGKVSYISPSSDPETRTFQTEIKVANPDGKLRDGVTASALMVTEELVAHQVPSSLLTLNDAGELGLRTLSEENIVSFNPVKIIGRAPEGVWITGLEGSITIITLGQEYVVEGQKVEKVLETASVAEGTN